MKDDLSYVLEAWAQVLDRRDLSPGDDFFRLGGTSLQAARVALALQRRTGKPVRLATVLAHSNAADLAVSLARLEVDGPVPAAVRSRPPGVARAGDATAVSYDQARRLLRDRTGAPPSWRIDVGYDLAGALHVERLSRSVDALVHKHEVLRSRFFVDSSERPSQQVVPFRSGVLDHVDLRSVDEEALRSTVSDFFGKPFDREQGEVFRALLVRRADTRWSLLLTADHLVCDKAAMHVLLRDLAREYTSPPAEGLPPPDPRFRHFVAWQRETVESARGTDARRFWREYLGETLSDTAAGVTPPGYVPGGQDQAVEPARWRTSVLTRHTATAAEAVIRQEGVTAFAIGLAALNLLLAGVTRRRDHVVASPVANRELVGFDDTVGWLSSLTAIRTVWPADATVGELRRLTATSYIDALQHAVLPWSEIIRTCQPGSYLGNPIRPEFYFDVVEPAMSDTLRLDGVRCDPLPAGGHGGYAGFNLVVVTDGEGWWIHLLANPEVFSPPASERLLEGYALAIEWLVGAPDRPLADAQRDLEMILKGHARGCGDAVTP
jgi:Condensation domain/Phosphopantetheine attachment site